MTHPSGDHWSPKAIILYNTNFPYSSYFDAVSIQLIQLLKIYFYVIFYFEFDRFDRRNGSFWYIVRHLETVYLGRSRELTKLTLLDPDHFQGCRVLSLFGGGPVDAACSQTLISWIKPKATLEVDHT